MTEKTPKIPQDKLFDRDHEHRLTRLEVVNENIAQTLVRLEDKMDAGFLRVDSKMDQGFSRLDAKMDQEFKEVNQRVWHNFYWILGCFAGVLALIAHGFKWIG